MRAIETLRAAARDPWSVAAEWKASGGGRKVVGFRCLYVPEEIVWAAGLLPWALYGTPEPVRQADAFLQPCTCELVRNLFDHALEGRLSFLDHLALCNTCDVVRRLHDNWEAYVPSIPVSMINNPQKLCNPRNRDYFVEELRRFTTRMEAVAGRPVTDEALRDAIVLLDDSRRLLREINELRAADAPAVSAVEMLDLTMAASVLPRDLANTLLRNALEELREREPREAFGPRILVTGSVVDHPALLEMIEEEGGVVVADDLCTTSRYFWHDVGLRRGEGRAPLDAIADFLDRRPLCACLHPMEARQEHLLGLVEHFRVDGVVDLTLKYCHPFLYEAAILQKELGARSIPLTVLEVGHDHSGHGQLRTRIQAFIEMLEL
jgi:benzoyl-CoA reductase subunit C